MTIGGKVAVHHREVVHDDTATIRGMIAKAPHVLEVSDEA